MKKTLLFLSLLLISFGSCLALTKADLVGCKWKSKPVAMPVQEGMEGMTGSATSELIFDEDGTIKVNGETTMSMPLGDGVKLDMFISITGKGKYMLLGNVITYKLDEAEVKLTEDDLRISGVPAEMESQADAMKQQLMTMMVPQIKQSIQEGATSQSSTMTNVAIDEKGKKLTCEEDGISYTYTKKKL